MFRQERNLSLNLTQYLRQLCVCFDALRPEIQQALLARDRTSYSVEELRNILDRISTQEKKAQDEQEDCYICLEGLVSQKTSSEKEKSKKLVVYCKPCMHAIHKQCYESLKKSRSRYQRVQCGLCRQEIQSTWTEEMVQEKLREVISFASEENTESIPPKFIAILKYLQKIPADEKIIVFSEFRKPISMIQDFLNSHGIASVAIPANGSGAHEIARFKTDPHIRVFLSTKKGSVGLNLIEANHVIFLSVPLSANVYQQSVDRCFRIGQQKPVHIVHLLTDKSIELSLIQKLRNKVKTIDDFYKKEVNVSVQALQAALKDCEVQLDELDSKSNKRKLQEHSSAAASALDSYASASAAYASDSRSSTSNFSSKKHPKAARKSVD